MRLQAGNIGVIKLLLENEADILATDKVSHNHTVNHDPFHLDNFNHLHYSNFQEGETALHKACKMCNYNVLKSLIDYARCSLLKSIMTMTLVVMMIVLHGENIVMIDEMMNLIEKITMVKIGNENFACEP